MLKKIIQISKEVYLHMGGLNFDEKDFQLAFGYELDNSKIDYMREISLEVFYKDIPVKLGSPDFFCFCLSSVWLPKSLLLKNL